MLPVFLPARPAPAVPLGPYRRRRARLNGPMAVHIDVMFDQATDVSCRQVRGGKVRAYAVTSRSRRDPHPISRRWMNRAARDFISPIGTDLAPKNKPADVVGKR